MKPDLDAQWLRAALAHGVIGREIDIRDGVGSTMDDVGAAAKMGAREGFVLIADYQSAGRGRLGRRWETPPGQAIAMSVLLRPHPATPELVARLPMIVGLSALDALDPLLPGRCALKWPNDVLIDGYKAAGLLVEAGWTGRGDQASAEVIVGLGMNVLQPESALPKGATSIAARTEGAPPSRTELAIAILSALDQRYANLLAGADPLAEWRDRLATIGREVEARMGESRIGPSQNSSEGPTIRGRAIGVTDAGALRIRMEDGSETVVVAGDVTLSDRPPSAEA